MVISDYTPPRLILSSSFYKNLKIFLAMDFVCKSALVSRTNVGGKEAAGVAEHGDLLAKRRLGWRNMCFFCKQGARQSPTFRMAR